MILKDKWYDCLKWLCLIGIPAVSVLYQELAKVWGWGLAPQVAETSTALILFIGAIIGISTVNYNSPKTTE